MPPKRSRTTKLLVGCCLFLGSISSLEAKDIKTSDSKGIALTVYNQNFGLVKDVRSITLKKGINRLRFNEVAAAIDPTSVSFISLTAPNSVSVREQNYQYDVIDKNTILSKSVGKEVTFRKILPGGGHKTISGTLLNPPIVHIANTRGNLRRKYAGSALKTENGIVINPSGQLELAKLPDGLVSKPSLLWKLESNKSGQHLAEISYQTKGLNWHCDYVAIANQDDTEADFTSWVTVDNKSGADYKNASLKLLAGDVHRVQNIQPTLELEEDANDVLDAAFAPKQFKEQSFAEYHLYSLAGKSNVLNNETKQLTLFNASNVPTKKLFVYEPFAQYGGYYNQNNSKKVNIKLEIENSEKNNLGMALPKGKVRVYKRDTDGALQFIGEDLVDHTPKDEKVRLYLGNAFDLVGERKHTSHKRPSQKLKLDSYRISLRNHKDSNVDITAIEHASGDWKITESSHKFKKTDSKTFEFHVNVPASSEVVITYQIQTRYQ